MKRIVEEVSDEGFESLLGKEVMIFCVNYIYSGVLVGVNSNFVKVSGAKIVYETGGFQDKEFKDAQHLPNKHWYIQINTIESFGGLSEDQQNS